MAITITSADMAAMIYDPTRVIKTVIAGIQSDGGINITNATNPFTMLIETAATTSNGSTISVKNDIRKILPSLAETVDQLYTHLTDDTLANMFSVPSKTSMFFYVNTMDLKQSGYRSPGANYVEMTIPANTYITIMKQTIVTLLNDIVVRLYDDNNIVIEQQANNSDIAINDIGLLTYDIYNDEEAVSWIVFITNVKQVKVTTLSPAISADEGVSVTVDTTDAYFYCEVSYANNSTNNEYIRIPITHAEEFIDPTTPMAYVQLGTNMVTVKIPDVYTVTGMISGTLKINVYETKGGLYLPINKYQFADFVLTKGDAGSSLSKAACKNIALLANAGTPISGGSDGLTLSELRDSIINSTTGDIDIPTSDLQVSRLGSMDGYYVYLAKDIIGDRIYVATKNLPTVDSTLVKCKQDVLFNTASVILSEVSDNEAVTIMEDYFIIKSGTLFKVNNGVVSILTNSEVSYLTTLSDAEKITYLKANKFYYTPYQYIISSVNGNTDMRVYSLDNPSIAGFRIMSQNPSMSQNVNTSKYVLSRTTTGYKLSISLKTDSNFDALDKNYVNVQLAIPLKGGEVNVYINGSYDVVNDVYHFPIESSMYVDADDYLTVVNGLSTLTSKTVSLSSDCYLYVYTTDATITDPTKFLVGEVYRENGSRTHVVFSKEKISLQFGKHVENLWNRVYNTYTGRKYKTYAFDYPKRYTEDVYVTNANGSIYTSSTVNGETVLVKNLLYSKGDIVVDENGNTVYEHKVGDTILDGNNNPIVDVYSGIQRFIDIIMLEYEFKVANSSPYVEYLSTCLDILDMYIFTDMVGYNKTFIDQTQLVYKSLKSCLDVTLTNTSLTYNVGYLISPTVTLYLNTSESPTSVELNNYRDTVGKIIDGYLDKSVIYLSDIKNDIIAKLGSNVLSVKIAGMDTSNNSEVITVGKSSNKLVLSKLLEFSATNDLEVKYDINIVAINLA